MQEEVETDEEETFMVRQVSEEVTEGDEDQNTSEEAEKVEDQDAAEETEEKVVTEEPNQKGARTKQKVPLPEPRRSIQERRIPDRYRDYQMYSMVPRSHDSKLQALSELTEEGNLDQEDMITEILGELSNHNERHEKHKNTILQLILLIRDGGSNLWDDHFKSILLTLLEILRDDDLYVRSLALRVLRWLLRNQQQRFPEYAELTTLRILEAIKDPSEEANAPELDKYEFNNYCKVIQGAEECAATLASYISKSQSIRVLVPIIKTAQFPINLAAIKMQTKVIEQIGSTELQSILPEIVPGLLKSYDDIDRRVRKASVSCLVAIYMNVGEKMRQYLTEMNECKVKLLNLYIMQAREH